MSRGRKKKQAEKSHPLIRAVRFILVAISLLYAIYLGLLYFIGEELPFIGPTFEAPMIAFAGAAFLLAVVFGMMRMRWSLVIPLAEAAFCVFMMQPRLNSFAEISPDDKIIAVMSYNVMMLEKDPEAVFATIKANRPDILFLQEFPADGEYRGRILDELFPGGDVTSENNNTVFTKYPIDDSEWLDISGKWSAYKVTIDLDGKNVVLCDVHLPASVPVTKWQRKTFGGFEDVRQLRIKAREVLTALADESSGKDVPLIMAGDFNSRPHSMLIRTLQKKLQDTFLVRGDGFGCTWNSDFAFMRIDYIFLSDQFNVFSHEVVEGKGSDHRPVLAKVTLNPSGDDARPESVDKGN